MPRYCFQLKRERTASYSVPLVWRHELNTYVNDTVRKQQHKNLNKLLTNKLSK